MERTGWVTSAINQGQQRQHKVRALQPCRPGPFHKAQGPCWSDSMCFRCQHHGKGSVLQWLALISKASGDVLMGSVWGLSKLAVSLKQSQGWGGVTTKGKLRSLLHAERRGVTFFTLGKCSFPPTLLGFSESNNCLSRPVNFLSGFNDRFPSGEPAVVLSQFSSLQNITWNENGDGLLVKGEVQHSLWLKK